MTNYTFNLLFVLIASAVTHAHAHAGGQFVINDYKAARSQYLFKKLYVNTGKSVYCGTSIPFPSTEKLTGEHVYPADWIAKHFGCDNRKSNHPDYKRAEAELHNLWPEIGRINSSRSDLEYGVIDDSLNAHRFKKLFDDFERTSASGGNQVFVEPRDSVKGNIARSLFICMLNMACCLKI